MQTDTKQQCTVHFPHVYTQNSSALYIFHTFIHKTAVQCTFSTRLYTKKQCTVHFPHVYTQNLNTVLIFLVCAGRKHKHIPQLHQTEKTDRNFGFENVTSLPECLSQCVNEKLGCLCRCKILCQMHAAQLFTAPGSTNANREAVVVW